MDYKIVPVSHEEAYHVEHNHYQADAGVHVQVNMVRIEVAGSRKHVLKPQQ